ncbi:hypothetical protein BDQ17DRAFT_629328 [Cyathus striatus]|nr:hypothetical protein BDQ17DRAFT_629328 [Cyathus striatus]
MGFLWGLLFGNWVTKTLKSKTLLVPMGRRLLDLKIRHLDFRFLFRFHFFFLRTHMGLDLDF